MCGETISASADSSEGAGEKNGPELSASSGPFHFDQPYWQPANCRLGVIATVVNGPEPVNAIGGFEFKWELEQTLVVIPSTA
jgi:hypothetical protein